MSWTAEMMGIDMGALMRELPTDLAQLKARRAHERASEAFWDWRRQPEREDLLSPSEASEMLFYSPNYVVELIHRGKLPAVKVDGRWRIERAVITDFLATRR